MAKRRGSRTIYVVAGSNGAGKTTFAKKFLPDYERCLEFINADLIAAGLSPLHPAAAAAAAGRLVLELIGKALAQNKSFAFETTLSGLSYAGMLSRAKKQGYRVHIIYLWIPGTALALKRIAERVKAGGHNVPRAAVLRRYAKSLRNIFNLYWAIADTVSLMDNSGPAPKLIAVKNGVNLDIREKALFLRMQGAAK